MSAEKLWEPSDERVERAAMTAYMRWLKRERGVAVGSYEELWSWSVAELEEFWGSIWDYFDVRSSGPYKRVLAERTMPGARWFEGAELNYAEHVFRDRDPATLAVQHASELRELDTLTWGELERQVAAAAAGLRALGVERGDRVVAYVPNTPEALVAFLATASIGAVWSSCSPDFGAGSVVDRFAQIEPKVLFAVDGYRYGGKDFDRLDTVAGLQEQIPSLEHTVLIGYLDADADPAALERATTWDALLASGAGAAPAFDRVPFDHPLWVLYSSGTTGLPKAIVQGQGGILLEHLKKLHLHVDAQEGDRIFWFTTTGWMMWNFLVSALLTPASVVLYDGNPGHPDMGVLWDLAERAGVTCFGTSASYIAACMNAGVEPGAGRDLSRLGAIGSTGSPLAPEGFQWIYDHVGEDTWLFSTSGGTDVCTAFVGGVPLLPVYRGELQARALGAGVEAWDADGNPLDQRGRRAGHHRADAVDAALPLGRRGRLALPRGLLRACTRASGATATGSRSPSAAPRSSTGARTRPSTARGSGWARARSTGRCRPSPRSSTPWSSTSPGRAPRAGCPCSSCCARARSSTTTSSRRSSARSARTARRATCPNEVFAIAEVPRTLSGKVLEVPVKRILIGTPAEQAASRDSLANPAALDWFVEQTN